MLWLARSNDGGRRFAEPRELSAPLPRGYASATFPSLALDGDGGVYVSWELSRRAEERPVSIALAVSRDGGRTFAAPFELAAARSPPGGGNGSHQGLLMRKLAAVSGRVALVNSTLVHGRSSRLWLLRGSLPHQSRNAE